MIRDTGAVPGIAVNPGTSVETIKELLPLCGHVLAMTVNPGFAGQAYLPHVIQKINVLCGLAQTYGFTLCTDGAMTKERIRELHAMGVHAFVLGTKALFFKGEAVHDYAASMRGIRG
jgi:ribulose-phosphate 3-epimerase